MRKKWGRSGADVRFIQRVTDNKSRDIVSVNNTDIYTRLSGDQ